MPEKKPKIKKPEKHISDKCIDCYNAGKSEGYNKGAWDSLRLPSVENKIQQPTTVEKPFEKSIQNTCLFAMNIFNDVDELMRGLQTDIGVSTHIWGEPKIYEEGNKVIVEINAPKFSPNKISVHVEQEDQRVVNISGRYDNKIEKNDRNFYHSEQHSCAFSRVLKLPKPVKRFGDVIESKNNILKITFEKTE